MALAAAGILPSYVLAAPNSPKHPSAAHRRFKFERMGTVSSVAGSSITLATKRGIIYTVDAQDARILKAGNTVSLATVAVGDHVAVIGPTQGDTIAAHTIFDGPRHAPRLTRHARHGNVIGGTIAAISPGEFTLVPKGHPGRPARPAITVDTNVSTVITRAGQPAPFSALGTDTEVIVSGTRAADGVLVASKILIRNR